jgi:hypothetical protein
MKEPEKTRGEGNGEGGRQEMKLNGQKSHINMSPSLDGLIALNSFTRRATYHSWTYNYTEKLSKTQL